MTRLNDNNPDFYYKFGRHPKKWTIESLHDLWLRSSERSYKRSKAIWDYINKIVEVIPPNDRGEHLVYYKQNGIDRGYVIRYESTFRGPSIGHIDLKFNSREEKIDFFLTTELNFKMGQELKRLRDLETNHNYVVFNALWYRVERSLENKFKNKRPNKSFILRIGNKDYIVSSKDWPYGKYNLESEYNGEKVEL